MNKKPPRLDEVFLVQNRNLMNVGSAYTHKRVGAFQMREASMKPDLEKVVTRYASELQRVNMSGEGSVVSFAEVLRRFAHEMEGTEGEDPGELDQGGPAPGTTGGQ